MQFQNKSVVKQLTIWIIELAALLLVLIFVTRLGYLQIVQPKIYRSDTADHMKFAAEGSWYSYLIPVMGILMKVSGRYSSWAIAILNSTFVMLTILAVTRWMKKIYAVPHTWAVTISFLCVFLSSLYIPVLQPLFYRAGIVTQPWHNIPYFGMRLFAVLTLLGFGDILKSYREGLTFRQWLATAIPLMLATAVKPNFLIAFSWTLLLYLIVDAAKGRLSKTVILQCIKLGTCVFPAILVMYLQSKVLYNGESASGIEVSLSTTFFQFGFIGTIIKLLRGLLLPAIVYVYNRKKLGRKEWFVLIQYVVSLLVVIFFHETGPRAGHGNFFWTQYCSGFLLFAVTLVLLTENIREICRNRQAPVYSKVYIINGCLLALWHFASGVGYFIMLSRGATYLI